MWAEALDCLLLAFLIQEYLDGCALMSTNDRGVSTNKWHVRSAVVSRIVRQLAV